MMPWFIWKGKNSYTDFGLWISKLPKKVRAEERHEVIEIPGRAGSVVMLEGEDVYNAYSDEMVVTARNDIDIQKVREWLRGTSKLVISTERDKARDCSIVGEVAFERLGNNLEQATIPLYCQPFKMSVIDSKDTFTIGNSGTIFNPGDVKSKPFIIVNGTGGTYTVLIGNASMILYNMPPGDVNIDCDAGIITVYAHPYDANAYYYVGEYATYDGDATYSAGLYRFTTEGIGSGQDWERVGDVPSTPFKYVWTGSVVGDFFRVNVGTSTFGVTANAQTVTIRPNWRWF